MSAYYDHDEEIRRKLAQMSQCANYGAQGYTCASTYSKPKYHPQTFERQKDDYEIKISVLTEENEKLKKEYNELVRKANIILEAYKKLETENNELKAKKAKKEVVTKTVGNTKSFFKKLWDNFIEWLHT